MPILKSDALDLPGIVHGFFGRRGGVSTGIFASLNCGPGSGDDRAKVIENRRRAAEALAPGTRLVTLGQIHGIAIVTVERPWPIGETQQDDAKCIPLGDGMVTAIPGIALGILTADCAPVLFADAAAGIVGAAHAGWKGALSGVLEAAIAAMERLGARRSRIAAAIGPTISQANYEVGAEFYTRFRDADSANARFFIASGRPEHFRFDLEFYVHARLAAAGLARVTAAAACTYAREGDFFSYRRATHAREPDYGRQISAISLSGEK